MDRLVSLVIWLGQVRYFFVRKSYLVWVIFIFVPSLEVFSKDRLSGLVWEVPIAVENKYFVEVATLIDAYESKTETKLDPGARGKVGIKVNTRSGRGLSTPLQLLRAVIDAFEKRGFARQSILIIDYSTRDLREAGILPPLGSDLVSFEGCPVYALDTELYYNEDWFYDSPLPSRRNQNPLLLNNSSNEGRPLEAGMQERKSFLPAPLLFEVDFWINLAVGVDDNSLGIDGVLANATLWNISNNQRFLSSEATASVAIAEVAAIPELNERMRLHFVSLEQYQYIGGPWFNARYTHSEPLLWMSVDPVALDRLLYDRINSLRLLNGFPEIASLPRQLPFAESLGLGVFKQSQIRVQRLSLDKP